MTQLTKRKWLANFSKKLSNDNLFGMSAELSYYTIFSLAPLLVILINSVSYFFDHQKVKDFVFSEMDNQLGQAGTEELHEMIDGLLNLNQGFLSTSIMIIVLLFLSTTLFVTLQRSLNKIFGIQNLEGYPIVRQLRKRAIAFGIIVGLAFTLMVSLLVNGFIIAFDNRLEELFPNTNFFIIELINWLIPILGPTILFTVFYKYLPEKNVSWRSVLEGAIVTALLFNIGKWIIAYYLRNSEVLSVYGAAGSIIALLIWVYYSALIFFLGAELVNVLESWDDTNTDVVS